MTAKQPTKLDSTCIRTSIVQIVESVRPFWHLDQHVAAKELISSLNNFRHFPTVDAICSDLQQFLNGQPLTCTRSQKEACNCKDGLIIGVFSSPYNSQMSLEAFAFDSVAVPNFLAEIPDSSAVPLELIASTGGFKNNRHVALFMEEMLGVDPAKLIEDKAYYFVNRFAERTLTRTIPLVRSFMDGPIVNFFNSLSLGEAKQLATAWVWLHEHFHRSGPLPLPTALKVKSSRTGGALEELRTDLKSIAAARRMFSPDFAKRLELFILGERLIRYGAESSMIKDYDARSSHLLLGMLRREEYLVPVAGKVRIAFPLDELPKIARRLVDKIESFENLAAHLPMLEAKKAYVMFGMTFLNTSHSGELIPWPELLKASNG